MAPSRLLSLRLLAKPSKHPEWICEPDRALDTSGFGCFWYVNSSLAEDRQVSRTGRQAGGHETCLYLIVSAYYRMT